LRVDALVFTVLMFFLVSGIFWIVGKAHHFEQSVAWSRRKE